MITAGLAVVLLCVAGLFMIRNLQRPDWLWRVRLVMAAVLGMGVAAMFPGVARVVGGVLGVMGAGVLMLLAILAIVIDVAIKKQSNKVALVALVALPLLFIAAGGPLADFGEQTTGSVNQTTTSGIANLLGG